jgi:phage terminase small subunit
MSTKQALEALSDRQAAFAVAYARHHNASQAARGAGYAQGCASVTGTRLLANARVLVRIRELEAQAAVDMRVTRQRFLFELQEAAALAKSKGDAGACIAAWREIGKACGFYLPERVKVDVNVAGSLEMGRLNRLSDAELLKIIEAG